MTENAATPFRTGFVAIFGKPNAGKSTLMNALVGGKIAAVSALPQTTRDRIQGILTDATSQVIFVDLPGLVAADDRLREALRDNVLRSVGDVDVILHLVDPTEKDPVPAEATEVLARRPVPALLVLNKLDVRRGRLNPRAWAGELPPPFDLARYKAVLGISALRHTGFPELLNAIRELLPPGPPLYDPEDLTDRDLRFLVAESIREKCYLFTHQEVPYSTAVVVDEFVERAGAKWYIHATVFVETDSQKRIVIGSGGELLKKISRAARLDIEKLAAAPVYLELLVKVRANWTKKDADLRLFGYQQPGGKKGR